MARVYDRLAKEALSQALRSASRELVPEREVAGEAQRLDLWYVPEPRALDTLEPWGLLQRIAAEGPCAFEFFHQAPSLAEICAALGKAIVLRQPARWPSRTDEPWLWIIAGGRPNRLFAEFGLLSEPGWPSGIYTSVPGLRMRLVVVSELPKTPETLPLRALGAGKTLRDAQRELGERGLGDPVAAAIIPLMVRLHLERRDQPDGRNDPEAVEFLMDTNDIYDAWHKKVRAEGEALGRAEGEALGRAEGEALGRAEGERRALLAVLAARGFRLSPQELELVEACHDLSMLETWLRRAVSAPSSEAVFLPGAR